MGSIYGELGPFRAAGARVPASIFVKVRNGLYDPMASLVESSPGRAEMGAGCTAQIFLQPFSGRAAGLVFQVVVQQVVQSWLCKANRQRSISGSINVAFEFF